MSSSGPPTLITLPPELLLAIFSHLNHPRCRNHHHKDCCPSDSRMSMLLRGVCRLFSHHLPRPTHQELLDIEKSEHWPEGKFRTCGGCIRLRRISYFDVSCKDLIDRCYLFDIWDLNWARTKFCLDCGVRDLPGDFRYQLGESWTDSRGIWIRCKNCDKIGMPLKDFTSKGLCEQCCRVSIRECRERGENLEPDKKWCAPDESSKVDEVRPEAPYHPALISLPTQLLQAVISVLESDSQLMLRGACRLFAELMPKARTKEKRLRFLIAIETEPWARHKFFACCGCERLRHARHFSMSKEFRRNIYAYEWPMVPGGVNAEQRFCRDCGARDDEYEYEEFTYLAGEEWFDEQGTHWVRCEKCLESSSPIKYLANKKLCEPCYLAGEEWLNEVWWSGRVKCKNCHRISQSLQYFARNNKLCAPCCRMKMKEWKRQVPLPMPDWEGDPIRDVLRYDEAMEVKRQLRIQDLIHNGNPLLSTLPTEILLKW